MKKILLISLIFITATVVKAATGAYSPVHVQHLKNCSPYTETYNTQIPTQDEQTPYLNIESTETIVGKLNGKCITKSSIKSHDLRGREIMSIKCAFSNDQMKSIIDKMSIINSQDDEQTRQKLQQELVSYIQDEKTCKVKNYLEETQEEN